MTEQTTSPAPSVTEPEPEVLVPERTDAENAALTQRIEQTMAEIRDIRNELREKETILAGLEKEAGITRFTKIKLSMQATAKSTGVVFQTVGTKVKESSIAMSTKVREGSLKLAEKFKKDGPSPTPGETSTTTPTPTPSGDEANPVSFSDKLRKARDGFTATLKRATSKTETEHEEPRPKAAKTDEKKEE